MGDGREREEGWESAVERRDAKAREGGDGKGKEREGNLGEGGDAQRKRRRREGDRTVREGKPTDT